MSARRMFVLLVACLIAWPAAARANECMPVFDPLQVLTLNLQLSQRDWDTIRKDTTFDIEVPATFWADGETGITVSVRRKRGRAVPSESNPQKVPLKIDINEFVDQKWRGLIKVSLENGAGSFGQPFKLGDIDVVREGLAWTVHRLASGSEGYNYLNLNEPPAASAAACASWVRVFVNGAYIGVYVNAEQRDKQFLKNRGLWTAGSTWLYEQEDVGTAAIEEGDGNSPTYTHLCYAPFRPKKEATCATPSNDDVLAADLLEWINMRAMLAACAADAVADNNDGLCSHGNNMFFVDFTGGQSSLGDRTRLYFPWDLDSVFGSATNSSIYVRSISRKGVVTQSPYQTTILNHPTFRANYNDILTALIAGPLSSNNLNAFLDQLEGTGLPAALASDPYPTVVGSIHDHFQRLRMWIAERITNIQSQIAANGPPPPR